MAQKTSVSVVGFPIRAGVLERVKVVVFGIEEKAKYGSGAGEDVCSIASGKAFDTLTLIVYPFSFELGN